MYIFLLLLHIIPIVILSLSTVSYLNKETYIAYALLAIISVASVGFASYNLKKFNRGITYYVLSILFTLGFLFKFSVRTILSSNDYGEPIGNFMFSSETINHVLLVSAIGILGLLTAQVLSFLTRQKTTEVKQLVIKNLWDKQHVKIFIAFVIMESIFAIINFKFNILLYGLNPAIKLPLYGNAVFFTLLTRIMLVIFLFYCGKKLSYQIVISGYMLTLIASVGVLSRMVTVVYIFAVFIVLLLQYDRKFWKNTFKSFAFIIVSIVFSYLTVFLSTNGRIYFYDKTNTTTSLSNQGDLPASTPLQTASVIPPINTPKDPASTNNFRVHVDTFKSLILNRWIGIEGVMAVVAYPERGWALFLDALNETTYSGNSFYTKISNPQIYNSKMNANANSVISTSVPGPISFFYYSNSLLFLSFCIFAFTLLLYRAEILLHQMFPEQLLLTSFIMVFISFDFYHFGVSPMSFFRYNIFFITTAAMLYYTDLFFKSRKLNA